MSAFRARRFDRLRSHALSGFLPDRHHFVVDGDTPILTGNSAQTNGGRGFVIGVDSGLHDTNTAENNVLDGFLVTGSGHTIKNNGAKKNRVTGFTISGEANRLGDNFAENSTGSELVIGQHNIDDHNDRKNGTAIQFGDLGGTFN